MRMLTREAWWSSGGENPAERGQDGMGRGKRTTAMQEKSLMTGFWGQRMEGKLCGLFKRSYDDRVK